MKFDVYTIVLILLVVGAAVAVLVVFARKKLKEQMAEQQALVNQHKQTMSIFVLDKKMDKIKNAKMPKSVMDEVPKIYRIRKMPMVRAKVGNQIMTFICDKKVYEKIPEKKIIKADIAGIYIASFRLK